MAGSRAKRRLVVELNQFCFVAVEIDFGRLLLYQSDLIRIHRSYGHKISGWILFANEASQTSFELFNIGISLFDSKRWMLA